MKSSTVAAVVLLITGAAMMCLVLSSSRVDTVSDHEALVNIIHQWEEVDKKNKNTIAAQQCLLDIYHARLFDGLAGKPLAVAAAKCQAKLDGTP